MRVLKSEQSTWSKDTYWRLRFISHGSASSTFSDMNCFNFELNITLSNLLIFYLEKEKQWFTIFWKISYCEITWEIWERRGYTDAEVMTNIKLFFVDPAASLRKELLNSDPKSSFHSLQSAKTAIVFDQKWFRDILNWIWGNAQNIALMCPRHAILLWNMWFSDSTTKTRKLFNMFWC